jgi:Icc protein
VKAELTTVADDEVVVHIGPEVRRYRDLEPDRTYELDGVEARTLPRPPGALLTRIATVNDIHFGETECGVMEGIDLGPILHAEPGEEPYPEVMNADAIDEITVLNPDAVVVKGDITTHGTEDEFAAYEARYKAAFDGTLHQVRGNHDAMSGLTYAAEAYQEVQLPGVTLAILDTVIPGHHTGRLTTDQVGWLDELGSRADHPVLVMGHHHPWDPASKSRPADYFGINPDDSEDLNATLQRREALIGYFAGHTHRNRVRMFGATPVVEVACVKDFPGSWAEYRVFEGGILQIHRRISSARALRWTDRTRAMFRGQYADYSFGGLADRCFALPRIGRSVTK